MKIDLEKTGLEMFFKDWQVPIAQRLLTECTTSESALKTSELTDYIQSLLNEEDKDKPKEEKRTISRASVIFFLQDGEEAGLFNSREETGKGGKHRLYWGATDMPTFLVDIRSEFTDKVLELGRELGLSK